MKKNKSTWIRSVLAKFCGSGCAFDECGSTSLLDVKSLCNLRIFKLYIRMVGLGGVQNTIRMLSVLQFELEVNLSCNDLS